MPKSLFFLAPFLLGKKTYLFPHYCQFYCTTSYFNNFSIIFTLFVFPFLTIFLMYPYLLSQIFFYCFAHTHFDCLRMVSLDNIFECFFFDKCVCRTHKNILHIYTYFKIYFYLGYIIVI